ncbi:hypothetical protein BOCO_1436 [Bombiscardovia coagulans]|uniref:Uncharacterized protein n=1 Tax=Bombiscardovia coagulans TaxID=686666 RepID=A0A261EPH8_9BIFI|nr:hypothetical protein BOCO_1436 [Bombiscardovia coagulans]
MLALGSGVCCSFFSWGSLLFFVGVILVPKLRVVGKRLLVGVVSLCVLGGLVAPVMVAGQAGTGVSATDKLTPPPGHSISSDSLFR